MPGAGRPHGPPAEKKQAAVTTGSAETSRHSPRDGFHAYFAISSVYRLVSHRRPRGHRPKTWRQHRGARTTRLRVRKLPFVRASRPTLRHPTATASRAQRSVTIAKRPSRGARDGDNQARFPKNGNRFIFLRNTGWFRSARASIGRRVPAPLTIGVLSDRNRRLPGRPTAAWLRRALCIGVRQAHGRNARSPRSTRLPRPVLARDCAGTAPLPCLEAHRINAIEPLSCGRSGCKHCDRSHEEKRAHHHTSWHEADQSERVCRRGDVHAGLICRRGGFRYPRRQATISCSGA